VTHPVSSQVPSTVGDTERLLKRVERERAARKEAERLLDEKSRDLFEANQQLQQAFHQLKLKADQTRSFIEHMPIGVIIATDDGIVESLNHLARMRFGAAPDHAQAWHVSRYLPFLDGQNPDPAGLYFDPVHPIQALARTEEGVEFACEVVAARLGGLGDTRTIWMVRDITNRILAEQKREQLEADLRQAQKLESLGTMAGGIAHELNTPIQFVTDNTKYLSTAFDDCLAAIRDLQSKVSAEIVAEVERAFDLEYLRNDVPQAITQSLDGLGRIAEIVLAIKRFSHPASATKEFNDIGQVIRTAVTVSKNQWKYVADLELDIASDLPSVKSNAGELNQVFLNLIVNAAQAVEDATDKPKPGKIKVSARAVPQGVECRISDTGTGIKPEHLDRIFDLFFTTKAPGRGTGQGLSVTHTIITQSHGGKIDVETELGAGTTFIITLPIEPPAKPGAVAMVS
jgi:two-component system, NtrC family, sensor kinase